MHNFLSIILSIIQAVFNSANRFIVLQYDRTRTTTIPPREYPQENARCEWKEFKNMKNSFCGDEKDDVISYVSALKKEGIIELTNGKKWILVKV